MGNRDGIVLNGLFIDSEAQNTNFRGNNQSQLFNKENQPFQIFTFGMEQVDRVIGGMA